MRERFVSFGHVRATHWTLRLEPGKTLRKFQDVVLVPGFPWLFLFVFGSHGGASGKPWLFPCSQGVP